MRLLTQMTAMLVSTFLVATLASAEPVLQISNGHLMGANGVLVDDHLYNVTFQDGTCSGLFHGCDGPTDFFFRTATLAEDASTALLSQVFMDKGTPFGNFGITPALTNGCDSIFACAVITAFSSNTVTMFGYEAKNFSGLPDKVNPVSFSPKNIDTGGALTSQTYAVWAAVPESETHTVPEPETFTLVLAGLALISDFVRGRKLKVTTA